MSEENVACYPAGITVDEVRHLLECGEPVTFIDSREAAAWYASRVKIEGAIRVDAERAGYLPELPPNRLIVVYRSCLDEDSSAPTVRMLVKRGFSATYLRGGFDAWLGAGLPLEPR